MHEHHEAQHRIDQRLVAAKQLSQQGDVLRSEVDKFLQDIRTA